MSKYLLLYILVYKRNLLAFQNWKPKDNHFIFISKTEYVLRFEAAFLLELNSLTVSNINIEMKVKNIRLMVFAITVMNLRLGKSRLFMKPNFWIMEHGEDPKDAVLDLNPAVLQGQSWQTGF